MFICVWIFVSIVQGELSTINRKQIYYLGILHVTTVCLQDLNVFFFLCLFSVLFYKASWCKNTKWFVFSQKKKNVKWARSKKNSLILIVSVRAIKTTCIVQYYLLYLRIMESGLQHKYVISCSLISFYLFTQQVNLYGTIMGLYETRNLDLE